MKKVKNRIMYNENIKKKIKEIESACTRCKKCFKVCPMLKDFGADPIDIVKKLEENLNLDLVYSCLLCGSCKVACPLSLPIPELLTELRIKIAKANNGKANSKGRLGVVAFQTWVSSPIFRGKQVKDHE